MRAGLLRHRLEIQEPVESEKLSGFKAKSWQTFATVWGRIEPLSGKELWTAQQAQAQTTHKLTVRCGDLRYASATMRATYGGRVFNFSAPPMNREERNVELTILAQEVGT